jgi:chemotaxis protein MotB
MAPPSARSAPTPVIRRSRRRVPAAHGGVWKIAYGDFITALMAFFLLMWMLTVTKSGDLMGVSAAFQNPIRTDATTQGTASGNASSLARAASEGRERRRGDGPGTSAGAGATASSDPIETVRQRLEQPLASNPSLERFAGRIFMDTIAEGLRIQIVDENNRPMFETGSAQMSAQMRTLLRTIGAALAEMDTLLRVEGHTDAMPFSGRPEGYGNWELSTERANAARREIVAGGYDPSRVVSVSGFADSVRLNASNPEDPLNRRISLLVMKRPEPGELAGPRPARAAAGPAAETSVEGAGAVPGITRTNIDASASGSIDLQPRTGRAASSRRDPNDVGPELNLSGRP